MHVGGKKLTSTDAFFNRRGNSLAIGLLWDELGDRVRNGRDWEGGGNGLHVVVGCLVNVQRIRSLSLVKGA